MSRKVTVRELIELLAKHDWDAPVFVGFENEPAKMRHRFKISSVASTVKVVEILIRKDD